MRRIHDHVQAIEQHASAIADLVTTNPDAALFTTNADIIPALVRAFNLKPTIDAALAYVGLPANHPPGRLTTLHPTSQHYFPLPRRLTPTPHAPCHNQQQGPSGTPSQPATPN